MRAGMKVHKGLFSKLVKFATSFFLFAAFCFSLTLAAKISLNVPITPRYQFSQSKSVINIGTQPLYLPVGLITETMSRDKILQNQLAALGMKIRFR